MPKSFRFVFNPLKLLARVVYAIINKMMKPIVGTLPSGKSFSVDLRLNHPTLLPGVQLLSEEVLLSGGKKLRPRLCFMVAEAIGVPFEKVAPYARVVELVHAATLAHDDVIDQATKRRGKPTLNDQLTQARAVLSGDLLLSRSMVELAELGRSDLLKRMAEVLEDLVTGEWLQLECRGSFDVSLITLENIARLKTASMLEWCAQVPFYLMNAGEKELDSARAFGKHLGIAFQCIDDCLDFSKASGKDYVKDLKEGQLNQVGRVLLDANPKLVHDFEILADEFETLVSAEMVDRAVGEVHEKAELNIELARAALGELAHLKVSPDSFRDLEKLLEDLLHRKS